MQCIQATCQRILHLDAVVALQDCKLCIDTKICAAGLEIVLTSADCDEGNTFGTAVQIFARGPS